MNEQNPVGRGRPRREDVYRRVHTQIGELRERMGGLPSPAEADGIWRGIWYEEAHHSTAIEGNTLVLKQVEQLLEEGRAVGNKELREYLEVRGYADAADWVYRQAISRRGLSHTGEVLTLAEVRHVTTRRCSPYGKWLHIRMRHRAKHPEASGNMTSIPSPAAWFRCHGHSYQQR